MLATVVREPFDRPGWIYEEKYDGYRVLAYKEGANVHLFSRNAIDRSVRFARVTAAVKAQRPKTLLLDGEVVIFDKKNVSKFQLLQRATADSIFVVFDCLYLNGKDLRKQPLSARRAALEKAVTPSEHLMLSQQVERNGIAAYKTAARKGLEGIIAKDLSSPYVESRSPYWLKVKAHRQDEFVIGGFTKPEGSRKHFGALLIGAYVDGNLYYLGKVGTGFDEAGLASLAKKLKPLLTKQSPFFDWPRDKNATFVRPKLVAQISYQELTEDRRLRQPVFLGLRDDKSEKDVEMP